MTTHTEWRACQKTVRVETDFHVFEVAYAEFGDGDPITLFLHGIPHWGYLYHEVHDTVQHAVIPDLAGYGYTRHLGEGGHDRSIRVQTELITAFLGALRLDAVQIVGHDIGGAVALRLAVYTDAVQRLVLSNAVCYDSFPVAIMHDLGLPAEARVWDAKDLDAKLDGLFRRPGRRDDREAVEAYVRGHKAPFQEPGRDPRELSRNAVATNTNETLELVPRLREIDAPTLLLWGADNEREYMTSSGKTTTEGQHLGYADRLARDIPSCEKRYIRDAGHNVMLDRPGAYREGLAAFLN